MLSTPWATQAFCEVMSNETLKPTACQREASWLIARRDLCIVGAV